MKKIFTLIVTLLLSITLFSCIIIEDEIEKENIILPNQNQAESIRSSETIYMSADPNGNINTMKVTNHLKNTNFKYYETYGQFEKDGHLNISYGNANILINENKALVPSLKNTENFFYMLNLNKNHYKDQLPFNVEVNYYLNNNKISYQDLKNASGEIGLELKITPNELNNNYFTNFGAQVQIPIDLTRAEILEHKGSMAQIQTGQQITLAYMVLPNSEQTIYIKLLGNDFRFDGIDITYQQLDFFDILTGYIDIDSLNMNEYLSMFSSMGELVQAVTSINNELKPLFDGINLLGELTNLELFMSLNDLITHLNSEEFTLGLNLPLNLLKQDLENKNQFEATFYTLNATIQNIVNTLTTTIASFNANPSQMLEMITLINTVLPYATSYSDFELIVSHIQNIALVLNNLDNFDINGLEDNKDLYVGIFKDVSEKGLEVEILFNNLIKNMYTLPLHLEYFVSNLNNISTPLIEVFTIFQLLNYLNEALNNYVDLVETIKALDGFMTTQHIDMFLNGLKSNDPNSPGLIDSLNAFNDIEVDEEQLQELYELEQLFISDNLIRPIDEIVLGFIEINNQLFSTNENQMLSFYNIMDKLNLLANVLEQIPVLKENDIISFLSDMNIPPHQVSFILRISGI